MFKFVRNVHNETEKVDLLKAISNNYLSEYNGEGPWNGLLFIYLFI